MTIFYVTDLLRADGSVALAVRELNPNLKFAKANLAWLNADGQDLTLGNTREEIKNY